MSLEVINKPIFTTIQDMGRFSYAHIGVSSSGVMDEYASMYANKLLSNTFTSEPHLSKYLFLLIRAFLAFFTLL